MKICRRCSTEKPLDAFAKRSQTAGGRQAKCRACAADIYAAKKASGAARLYREANRDKALQASRNYYQENREQMLIEKKAYYQENREKILQKRKLHNDKTNRYVRERAQTLPILSICKSLKGRLSYACRTMGQKLASGKALRSSRENLKQRIEMNFKQGMTWANYGLWEVDHIKPVAAFAAQGKDVKLANLFCNLRPEWASDNKKKSSLFRGIAYRVSKSQEHVQNA